MSKLTLDEAIKHCLEVAEQKEHESFIDRWSDDDEWSESVKEKCRQCAADHRQLAEWLTELKEAKRLLKAAAKIVKNLPCDDDNCGECVHNDNGYVCSEYEYFEWRYAAEALALIGEDTNVPAREED